MFEPSSAVQKPKNLTMVLWWITASCLQRIAAFVVLAEVKAHHFIFISHAQPDQCVSDLEQDKAADERKADTCGDRNRLDQELFRIAEKKTVSTGGIHRHAGEESGQQGSERTADTMDTNDVERVIVTEAELHPHRAVADDSCDCADDYG